ncbi:hypothetical protein M514_01819 [Trichuris suis]|uniref:Protein SDA1 homolog n=1 Tax=Trichuris suis TaxID=68888 RepID=A0A085NT96_9BILA|nr:hypothetical protein M514_01819 [Trichuris suis]
MSYLYPTLEDMKIHQYIQARRSSTKSNSSVPSEQREEQVEKADADDSPCPWFVQEYTSLYADSNASETMDCSESSPLLKKANSLSNSLDDCRIAEVPADRRWSTAVDLECPITGTSKGFHRAVCNSAIREVVCSKDAYGLLGLRIRSVDSGIFIQFVRRDSTAASAGLRFGDQILQVNDEFVTGMDCEDVVNILEKCKSDRIVLAIRDRPFARTVTMHRDNAGAFGFQLYAGRIKHIVPQSSAARNGLLVDHQIIEVNGQNVVGIGNKKLTHMISCCAQTLTVTIMPYSIFEKLIKRLPSGLMRKMMDHSVPNLNMSHRKVSRNLALLKEKLGQDPESYREEFFDQFRHFQSILQLMELQPQLKQEGLVEVVFFLCTAAQFYPEAALEFRDQLMALLKRSASDLDSPVRVALCKALLLLNTRKMIGLTDLVGLFLELLKCRDKTLRLFLFTATVNRLRKMNATRRDQKLNSSLQAMFLWHLQESNALIARFSLLVLIDLYRRRIWRDAKMANGIAQASLNPVNRIAITAVRFLLGSDVTCNKGIADDDDDEEEDDEPASDPEDQSRRYRTLKEMLLSYRVGKKSKKRCRMLEKAKEEMKKKNQKKQQRKKSFFADMSAIEMIYDPQEFAEKLFRKLQASRDKYEIRLLYMALISRVIMVHRLILLSFYPFLQRYLTPHQRDVTKLLLFAAHASHDLVPPDVVEALVRVIAYNFITDRNSTEAITVGLNAIREIVCRCPLAISMELMQDLAGYKKYKNKNVAMGARSLIHLFRRINPKALTKKDRGRPTVASAQQESIAKPYGTRQVTSFVPGAENLTMEEIPDSDRLDENENASSDNEGSWIDVSDDDDSNSDLSDSENYPTSSQAACSPNVADEQVDRAKKAEEICSSRVLTQTEFEKIAASRIVDSVVPASRKRKSRLSNQLLIDSLRSVVLGEIGSEKLEDYSNRHVFSIETFQLSNYAITLADDTEKVARLKDIEHLHKRPKLDKQARIESVKSGRKGRQDYGKRKRRGPHVGRTQRELAKRKAFSMVKHKVAKKRKNRSFRQQQQALRGHARGSAKKMEHNGRKLRLATFDSRKHEFRSIFFNISAVQ